jgi:alternate signal-mediated exported protein
MNKKILGSVVAMVAVLALVGGGTFAAWFSEQTIDEHSVEAGHLTLSVTDDGVGASSATPISVEQAYPGMQAEWEWYVANQSSVPTALQSTLGMTLQNLVAPNPEDQALADEVEVRIHTRGVNASNQCSVLPTPTPLNWTPLSDAIDQQLNLTHPTMVDGDKMVDGSGVCVRLNIRFPESTATNASQNGSLKFDSLFRLDQVT